MRREVRLGLMLIGVATLAMAFGYTQQSGWALATFPWEIGRLSVIFVGSILAAVAAAILWIAASGEVAGLPPGALNLAIIRAGSRRSSFGSGTAVTRISCCMR